LLRLATGETGAVGRIRTTAAAAAAAAETRQQSLLDRGVRRAQLSIAGGDKGPLGGRNVRKESAAPSSLSCFSRLSRRRSLRASIRRPYARNSSYTPHCGSVYTAVRAPAMPFSYVRQAIALDSRRDSPRYRMRLPLRTGDTRPRVALRRGGGDGYRAAKSQELRRVGHPLVYIYIAHCRRRTREVRTEVLR